MPSCGTSPDNPRSVKVVAKRILYIHGIGNIGGAERDLLAMVQALSGVSWEVQVACPLRGQLYEVLIQAGISVHPLVLSPWRKWFSPFVRWRGVMGIRGLLKQLKPALIHVNDIWWVPHTVSAVNHALARRTPIVTHVRQEIEPEKVSRYWLSRVDAVIAISKQVEQALIAGGVSSRSIRTIYSGLDLSKVDRKEDNYKAVRFKLGVPPEAVLLGTVANLFPRKGYDVMLRALPMILKADPSTQYVIIGTGEREYEQTLRKLSEELGIAHCVHFYGFQDPVWPFLEAMDLYVHPARMEGFGIAVIEAMAAGKAVVATNTGGLPEVVEHGRTGLLVALDNPEALSAAVVSLLKDKQRRDEMGERGAKLVRERFDLKASMAAIEQVYYQVLADR
jgi:glycosyltransferase involved in cell wall biosynthesis